MSISLRCLIRPAQGRIRRYVVQARNMTMSDWATLPSSQQPETAAQLINDVNELKAQISTVLNQLNKANTTWQDIIAGLSGTQKEEEQTLYLEMSQKPENLLTDIDAASEQLVHLRFFRERLQQRAHQFNDQSSAQTQATSQAIAPQAQLAVNERDEQQPIPSSGSFHI